MNNQTFQILNGLKDLMALAKQSNCISKYNGTSIKVIADKGYAWNDAYGTTTTQIHSVGIDDPEELLNVIKLVHQELEESKPTKQ